MPAEISVVCGEVLYQLRSALDHAAYAVANLNGFSVLDRDGFPIEETREKFEATISRRKVEQRLPRLAGLLREFKPYKEGNDLLWWLHRLNGAEKHKDLVLIAVANVVYSFEFMTDVEGRFRSTGSVSGIIPNGGWHRLGEEVITVTLDRGSEVKGNPKVTMDIVFGEIESAPLPTVTTTLRRLSVLCEEIVDRLEETFAT